MLHVISEIKKHKKASANINSAIHPGASHQWQSYGPQYHILQTPSTAIQLYDKTGKNLWGYVSPLSDFSENSSIDSLNF